MNAGQAIFIAGLIVWLYRMYLLIFKCMIPGIMEKHKLESELKNKHLSKPEGK